VERVGGMGAAVYLQSPTISSVVNAQQFRQTQVSVLSVHETDQQQQQQQALFA